MLILLRGRQIEVTDAMRHYAEQKLRRVEHLAAVEEADVTFAVNGHKQDANKVEVLLRLDGATIRVEERTADMYAAVDKVADKLERKLRKLKEKLRKRLRRGALMGLAAEAGESMYKAEPEPFEIGRVKRLELKPVDVEEAILEMKLQDHSFHMFVNRETQGVEIVYKRFDGTYGLITT